MSTAFAGSVIDPIDDKYIDQRQMVSEGGPLGPENFHSDDRDDSQTPEEALEDIETIEDIDEEYQRQRRMVWEGGPLGPENYHW